MASVVTPTPGMPDIPVGGVVYGIFNTHKVDNTPHALAGTPALMVYKDDGLTEDDSGITLSVDHDTRVGMNSWKVDTSSDGTFYATGHTYFVVITTGTVNSLSAVGCVVGAFTIGKGVDVVRWLATAVGTPDTNGYPVVTVKDGTGAGEINTTSGEVNARLSTQGKADVNAEVIDVIATDTHAEIGQEAMAATQSYGYMVRALYKALRNKWTITATLASLFGDDAATVDQKFSRSDDNTTYTKGEIASGP